MIYLETTRPELLFGNNNNVRALEDVSSLSYFAVRRSFIRQY